MSTLIDFNNLQTTNVINNESILLIEDAVSIKKIYLSDFYNDLKNTILSSYNTGWNANYINNIPVDLRDIADNQILVYLDNEGGIVPSTFNDNYIDWTALGSVDQLIYTSNNELISKTLLINEINVNETNAANKYLKVSDDGSSVELFQFDLTQMVNYASSAIADANKIYTGFFTTNTQTLNIPVNEDGFIIAARPLQNDLSSAQIFISIDSPNAYVRHNSGANTIDDYSSWFEIYTPHNHPMSDSINLDNSTTIGSSKAVYDINQNVDVLIAKLNPTTVLSMLETVDGPNSGLDADTLSGYTYTNLTNRYVKITGSTMSGDLNITNNASLKLISNQNSQYTYYSVLNNNPSIVTNFNLRLLNGTSAQNMNAGSLLVSDNISDLTNVPTNGIYAKGIINTASGYDINSQNIVDFNGQFDWNNIKNIPSDVFTLGTASQYNVGTSTGQVPLIDNTVKLSGDYMTGSLVLDNYKRIQLNNTDGSGSSGSFYFESSSDAAHQSNAVFEINQGTWGNSKFSIMSNGSELFRLDSSGLYNRGREVFHSGNDGSGSGLNASLLDGQNLYTLATSSTSFIYDYYFSTTQGYIKFNHNGIIFGCQWKNTNNVGVDDGSTVKTIYMMETFSSWNTILITQASPGNNSGYHTFLYGTNNNYLGVNNTNQIQFLIDRTSNVAPYSTSIQLSVLAWGIY